MTVDIHTLIDAVAKAVTDGNWDNPIVQALAHASPTMFIKLVNGEDGKYRVVMVNDGGKKIPAIKLIRELTNMGLVEAKHFVESLPRTVEFSTRPSYDVTVQGTELTVKDVNVVENIVKSYHYDGIPWECFKVERV